MNCPIFKSRYFWFSLSLAFGYSLLSLYVYTFQWNDLSLIWSEGNVGENIAAAAWGFGGVLCLIKFIFFFDKKDDLMIWLWCFFAFFLGFTRELDLHKSLENMGGMTWKTHWLGDQSVSLFLKIAIIALMICAVGGMMGSLMWQHRRLIRGINAGHLLITLFMLGFIYMAFGFLLDGSVLGKKVFFPLIGRSFAKLCEEVFETIGAVLAFLSVVPFFYKKNSPSIDLTK